MSSAFPSSPPPPRPCSLRLVRHPSSSHLTRSGAPRSARTLPPGAPTTCLTYLGLSKGSHRSAARRVSAPPPPPPPSRRRHLRARERGHCAEPARGAGGGCCGADAPPPRPPLARLRGRARPPRPGRTRGAAASARGRSRGAAASSPPPPSPAGPRAARRVRPPDLIAGTCP